MPPRSPTRALERRQGSAGPRDRSRGFFGLLRLQADEDATDNEVKLLFARGLSGAKKKIRMIGSHPQDDPVRPVIELPR